MARRNFECDSLDGLLIQLYQELLECPDRNVGSRGDTVEIVGVSVHLRKPRARISRSENRGKPFSALGELLWYLSGDDSLEFIRRYVPAYEREAEDGTIHGAYGPRIFAMRGEVDQWMNIEKTLRAKPGSRRAVVQLFNAEDIASKFKEIPCTTTLQFLLRRNKLDLSVTMRSNDAYRGLPHDVFCFTMIQEIMARRLGAELGEYHQYVGSMHMYERDRGSVKDYCDEGWHRLAEMPPMPEGDPFHPIAALVEAERLLRRHEDPGRAVELEDPYWADILRLLQVFWAESPDEIDELKGQFSDQGYHTYLSGRRRKQVKRAERAKEKAKALVLRVIGGKRA